MKNRNQVFSALSIISVALSASISIAQAVDPQSAGQALPTVPSSPMSQIVSGVTLQPSTLIQDERLDVRPNLMLMNFQPNLPGWSVQTGGHPDADLLKIAFGVRTPPPGTALSSGMTFFYASRGVGRSGIWENTTPGAAFAVVNGVPLNGLTIKGYGGNTAVPAYATRQQPAGSLDASEAYRDTLLSKICIEKGIDTYVGALTIVRNDSKANFIRLSRSALRMNDIIDRTGPELAAVVDHLTSLLVAEVGHRMSPQEFATWLTRRTAHVLATKEYEGLRHGSITKDNLGIAELVDHGEGGYDPARYTDAQSVEQLTNFKRFLLTAVTNLSTHYGFQIDAETVFNETVANRKNELTIRDQRRLVLDTASRDQLRDLRLSNAAIDSIIRLQAMGYGVLGMDEVLRLDGLTDQDKAILRESAGTEFQKIAGGRYLPNTLIEEIGGGRAVREVIDESLRKALSSRTDLGDTARMAVIVKETLVQHLIKAGRKNVADWSGSANYYGAYGALPVEHLVNQMSKFVVEKSQTNIDRLNYRLPGGGRALCRALFASAS